MVDHRPAVFIGSSSEGHDVAKAIQLNLDRDCEVTVWSQGIFGLSSGTLESLVEKADEFDFAVLVVTPDDMVQSRGRRQQAPRDNVLLELGFFIGAIGAKRTFLVSERAPRMKLPSDLAGISRAEFQRHASGNLQATVGAACTQVEQAIKKLGLRNRQQRNPQTLEESGNDKQLRDELAQLKKFLEPTIAIKDQVDAGTWKDHYRIEVQNTSGKTVLKCGASIVKSEPMIDHLPVLLHCMHETRPHSAIVDIRPGESRKFDVLRWNNHPNQLDVACAVEQDIVDPKNWTTS